MATKNKPVERYKLLAELKASPINIGCAEAFNYRRAPTLYAVKNNRGTRLVTGADVTETS